MVVCLILLVVVVLSTVNGVGLQYHYMPSLGAILPHIFAITIFIILVLVGFWTQNERYQMILFIVAACVFVLLSIFVAVSLSHRVHAASLILSYAQSAYFRDYNFFGNANKEELR